MDCSIFDYGCRAEIVVKKFKYARPIRNECRGENDHVARGPSHRSFPVTLKNTSGMPGVPRTDVKTLCCVLIKLVQARSTHGHMHTNRVADYCFVSHNTSSLWCHSRHSRSSVFVPGQTVHVRQSVSVEHHTRTGLQRLRPEDCER